MADLPRLALSIRQPWAWAIIYAGKDVENRDWPTRFRGPICIHAAKGMTVAEYEAAHNFMWINRLATPPGAREESAYPERTLDRGGIIGTAEIADCVEASASPWFFGRYGFVLRNVQPVDFIQVKGALGFFDWRKQEPRDA